MSCEGGGGRCRPSDPEVVKLEMGSMGRKVGAGISGAGEVLLYVGVGESLAVGTGRLASQAGFSSGSSISNSQADSACSEMQKGLFSSCRYRLGT